MPTRVDPYKNFNFVIEVDGLPQAGFSECSGLSTEVNVVEYREGGDFVTRKLPGLAKIGDITLKRGVTASADLQLWMKNILNGVKDRRDVIIKLLDDDRTEVVRWKFFNAFPRKWEGPTLNAKGNEVAIESLVLAGERLERDT